MIINEVFRKLFRLSPPYCATCDVLEQQLAAVNAEKAQLLNALLDISRPVVAEKSEINIKEIKPIHRAGVPWRVRQQMLEENDRANAAVLRRVAKENEALTDEHPASYDIEGLEKQLNINPANGTNNA